jgi:hypothetical protein
MHEILKACCSKPTEFLNDDYLVEGLEQDILAIADSIEPSDVELNYPGTNDYVITYAQYEDYQIDNYYITDEDEDTLTAYVEVAILFQVELSGQVVENKYDAELGRPVPMTIELGEDSGWINQSFEIIVDKRSKEIVETTLYA